MNNPLAKPTIALTFLASLFATGLPEANATEDGGTAERLIAWTESGDAHAVVVLEDAGEGGEPTHIEIRYENGSTITLLLRANCKKGDQRCLKLPKNMFTGKRVPKETWLQVWPKHVSGEWSFDTSAWKKNFRKSYVLKTAGVREEMNGDECHEGYVVYSKALRTPIFWGAACTAGPGYLHPGGNRVLVEWVGALTSSNDGCCDYQGGVREHNSLLNQGFVAWSKRWRKAGASVKPTREGRRHQSVAATLTPEYAVVQQPARTKIVARKLTDGAYAWSAELPSAGSWSAYTYRNNSVFITDQRAVSFTRSGSKSWSKAFPKECPSNPETWTQSGRSLLGKGAKNLCILDLKNGTVEMEPWAFSSAALKNLSREFPGSAAEFDGPPHSPKDDEELVSEAQSRWGSLEVYKKCNESKCGVRLEYLGRQ